jgi:hypothetical protein
MVVKPGFALGKLLSISERRGSRVDSFSAAAGDVRDLNQ